MNDFVVRPFQPSDTDAAKSLISEMHNHEMTLQTCLLPWESCKDAFWEWLLPNVKEKSGFMLVAEDKKRILGFVAGWEDKENYPGLKPHERRFGYVSDFVVTASARRRGVGSALLKAAENVFLERGLTIVRLMAFANNELADEFYLGFGMQRYVTIYKKYLAGAA